MNYKNLLLLSALTLSLCGFSQEKKAMTPTDGKAIIRVFANYNSNLGGNDQVAAEEAMQIKRAYLGYKASLSENFSMKVLMDVGNSGGIYSAYLKAASLKYKKGKLAVNLGLISGTQFKVQEKFWGYRYIYKSYQDQYKYGPSADLGLNVSYKIADAFSVDANIHNGEGYKKVDPTGTYKGGFGATAKFKPLTFRVYYDISAKPEVNRQNIATFIGYKFKDKFRIGGEYNYHLNNGFAEDHNKFGYSVYSTFIINKKFEVFARYDDSQSNVIDSAIDPLEWNNAKDEQVGIFGLQYKAHSKVKISANYRRVMSAVEDADGVNWFFVNLEFKL